MLQIVPRLGTSSLFCRVWSCSYSEPPASVSTLHTVIQMMKKYRKQCILRHHEINDRAYETIDFISSVRYISSYRPALVIIGKNVFMYILYSIYSNSQKFGHTSHSCVQTFDWYCIGRYIDILFFLPNIGIRRALIYIPWFPLPFLQNKIQALCTTEWQKAVWSWHGYSSASRANGVRAELDASAERVHVNRILGARETEETAVPQGERDIFSCSLLYTTANAACYFRNKLTGEREVRSQTRGAQPYQNLTLHLFTISARPITCARVRQIGSLRRTIKKRPSEWSFYSLFL